MRFIGKMFARWFGGKEEDATENTFGSVLPLRVGNGFSVSPVFTTLLADGSLFKELFPADTFQNLTVETVLSYELDGSNIYRLHFTTCDHIVQIQETNGGQDIEVVLLGLVADVGFRDNAAHDEFVRMMNEPEIEDEDGNVFENIFAGVRYTEKMRATLKPKYERPVENRKLMSLFDRRSDDFVDYILYDVDENDWYAEQYIGVVVPQDEITVN